MNCNDEKLIQCAQQVGELLSTKGLVLATAESCTGGGIAYFITSIPGSSAWFDRSFVTYTNASKQTLLNVKPETLARHGAVSEQTATEMVVGALAGSEADIAIATTGIAGPDGGSAEKPVGTVYVSWQRSGQNSIVERLSLQGNRAEIRRQTIYHALDRLLIDSNLY